MRNMSHNEILASYRQAKDKKKQIKILAELNLCGEKDIVRILEEQGEVIPKPERKPKTAKDVPDVPEPPVAPVAPVEPVAPDVTVAVTLTPGEAETLADYIGMTLMLAIRKAEWGIENPEYIGDLANIYERCRKLAEKTGSSEFAGVFRSGKRGREDVW